MFDYFHHGHLKLFERAAKLGDNLIVAIQRDEEVSVNKPNACLLYCFRQRVEIVSTIRFVDKVFSYSQRYRYFLRRF